MQYTKSIRIRTRTETLLLEIDDGGNLQTTFGEGTPEVRNYLMEIELLQYPEPTTKIVRWDLPPLSDPYEVEEPPPEP